MQSLLGAGWKGKTDSFEHLPLLQGITGGLVYLEPVSGALRLLPQRQEGSIFSFLLFLSLLFNYLIV
jgi:hypothetical protein